MYRRAAFTVSNKYPFKKTKEGKNNIIFKFKDKIKKNENLGHTVQLDFVPGSTISQNGKMFKQLHFHEL